MQVMDRSNCLAIVILQTWNIWYVIYNVWVYKFEWRKKKIFEFIQIVKKHYCKTIDSYLITLRDSVPKQPWLVLIFMHAVIFDKNWIYQNQVQTLRLMMRCFANASLFSQSAALRRNTIRSNEQDVLVRNITKTNLVWKLQTNLCAKILCENLFIYTNNIHFVFSASTNKIH